LSTRIFLKVGSTLLQGPHQLEYTSTTAGPLQLCQGQTLSCILQLRCSTAASTRRTLQAFGG
jgi:hypothetical protein